MADMGEPIVAVHYAVLLRPEDVCLNRVRNRAGHGFTDLDAARRMYREFVSADVSPRHLLDGVQDPHRIASSIGGRFREGALRISRSGGGP
jgi:hypothetical protein